MWTRLSDRALSLYVRLRVGLAGLLEDARGLQTLEWVALAVVILALLGAVAAYIRSHPDVVGGAVAEAIRSFFARLTETFGPILSPFFPFPFPGGPPNA